MSRVQSSGKKEILSVPNSIFESPRTCRAQIMQKVQHWATMDLGFYRCAKDNPLMQGDILGEQFASESSMVKNLVTAEPIVQSFITAWVIFEKAWALSMRPSMNVERWAIDKDWESLCDTGPTSCAILTSSSNPKKTAKPLSRFKEHYKTLPKNLLLLSPFFVYSWSWSDHELQHIFIEQKISLSYDAEETPLLIAWALSIEINSKQSHRPSIRNRLRARKSWIIEHGIWKSHVWHRRKRKNRNTAPHKHWTYQTTADIGLFSTSANNLSQTLLSTTKKRTTCTIRSLCKSLSANCLPQMLNASTRHSWSA